MLEFRRIYLTHEKFKFVNTRVPTGMGEKARECMYADNILSRVINVSDGNKNAEQ